MTQEHPKPKEINLSKVKYIISDWDGTLVNSLRNYANAFAKVITANFGGDPEEIKKDYISTAGTALTDQIQQAAQKFTGQQIIDTAKLEQQFWSSQIDLSAPTIIEGARETLIRLKNTGLTIVVWSGTKTEVLRQTLKDTGLDQFVAFAIGNVPGSKTMVKGEWAFGEIARELGISVEDLRKQSLVVGDGIGDIKAGKSVHCPTVAVLKTGSEEVLTNAGADFIIAKIGDLPALLSK